uniref:Uncharacterized protein n=1 Tax=Cannabis sativa TaxID=3483 RepID=A0A803Q8A6_CANSA
MQADYSCPKELKDPIPSTYAGQGDDHSMEVDPHFGVLLEMPPPNIAPGQQFPGLRETQGVQALRPHMRQRTYRGINLAYLIMVGHFNRPCLYTRGNSGRASELATASQKVLAQGRAYGSSSNYQTLLALNMYPLFIQPLFQLHIFFTINVHIGTHHVVPTAVVTESQTSSTPQVVVPNSTSAQESSSSNASTTSLKSSELPQYSDSRNSILLVNAAATSYVASSTSPTPVVAMDSYHDNKASIWYLQA